jgi:hypothetical protein
VALLLTVIPDSPRSSTRVQSYSRLKSQATTFLFLYSQQSDSPQYDVLTTCKFSALLILNDQNDCTIPIQSRILFCCTNLVNVDAQQSQQRSRILFCVLHEKHFMPKRSKWQGEDKNSFIFPKTVKQTKISLTMVMKMDVKL